MVCKGGNCGHFRLWYQIYSEWIALGRKVIVVHFEEIKRNPMNEVTRVLDFFDIPYHPERIKCLDKKDTNLFLRSTPKKTLTRDLINGDVMKKVDEQIEKLQRLLKQYGHPDIPFDLYDL